MKNSPLFKWCCSVASEFVEGLADGFIIVAGGAQAAAALTQVQQQIRAVSPQELLTSILVAGVWYVAAFVKKNPPPFGQSEPVATPPPSSAT